MTGESPVMIDSISGSVRTDLYSRALRLAKRRPLPHARSYSVSGRLSSQARTAVNTVFGLEYKSRFPVYAS